jgi:hypothetical protein
VLALPSLEQSFHLFVNVNKGAALGVLTQKHRGQCQPVAFLSKFLHPVTQCWPEHTQAVAATALLTEESRKITFWRNLIIITPHQVRTILNQKVGKWLTDSRILKYEAILLEKDDLTLTTDEDLNPATFLAERQEGGAPKHKCLDITEYQTKVSPDLGETPFQTGFHFFVDGSSPVIEGKRHNGYSIVNGEAMTINRIRLTP